MEYNTKYERTGNSIVKVDDNQKVFTDSQLISALQQIVKTNKSVIEKNKDIFAYYIENIPSFRNFLDQYNIELFSQETSL